jgi:hypothetical protein
MNLNRIIFIAAWLSLLFLTECSDNLVGALTDGIYNYTAYDSLGVIVAKGTLSFKFKDSTNIIGEWEINKIGDHENIGPQIGNGELKGNLTDGRLSVELNPDFRDNNVFLEGKPGKNKYTGKWFYSSFIGLTNRGTFVAEKK